MALAAGVEPAQRGAAHEEHELAALIVIRGGHATQWRLERLDHDDLVDAWERRMLLAGCHYAALFSHELDALRS